MPLSLPADPPSARSLTDVVSQTIAALEGGGDWFPPARSAIVVLVDGLGRANLTARSGHARFLSSRLAKADAVRAGFPSTTATSLTSLLTGRPAGEHGIVGYRVRVPETGRAVNQLKGWESDGLDPLLWQRSSPLFELEASRGRPCFVVSKGLYAGTGFTTAIQRGATFLAAGSVAERLARAVEAVRVHDGALVYVYVPELDTVGHASGWESTRWLTALEDLDRDLETFTRALPAGTGALVTADHGMVDVPAHKHVLLREGDPLVDEVDVVAGEPRMLHLYTETGSADRVLSRWRESEHARSWVMSRAEAIDAGLFGPRVEQAVAPRIGDVLVAARSAIAYYDDREPDKKPQRMIGQHGSLTDQERIVPLVRLGAFSR
ncbi:alkaline phosphatase family protein [Microbacterium sp. TNHR37B]|uniref:alkaline phosphatase family protein n=1 Tax=Microbacterium sp. TNHR37B TaxID=1775956 RepID=UPI0007B272D7|nr:nucleotide pyrophosphatase/phosphodiesterase family protein [Microbacterium sp. TNHR37B]KZE90909.1 hypothetical protein AVP41_00434 [Microbacterium sp. TNHR37B]